MILWAKAQAVGAKVDQRVELIEVVGGNIRVRLCGTDEIALIAASEVSGLEYDETSTIRFKVTRTERNQNGKK